MARSLRYFALPGRCFCDKQEKKTPGDRLEGLQLAFRDSGLPRESGDKNIARRDPIALLHS